MLNLMDYFGRTEVYGRDWVLLDPSTGSQRAPCVRLRKRKADAALTSATGVHQTALGVSVKDGWTGWMAQFRRGRPGGWSVERVGNKNLTAATRRC